MCYIKQLHEHLIIQSDNVEDYHFIFKNKIKSSYKYERIFEELHLGVFLQTPTLKKI